MHSTIGNTNGTTVFPMVLMHQFDGRSLRLLKNLIKHSDEMYVVRRTVLVR